MNIHNFHGNQRRFHRVLTVHLIDSSHESAYNECKPERTDSPMKLNADIVYEGLKKKYPVTMSGPKSTQLTISRPELYLDNEVAFYADHLYLATVDHLPVHPQLQKNAVIVVIGEGAKLFHYREQCCLIVIEKDADFFEVNRCICQLFDRYYAWEQKLFDIFLDTADLQQIVACSEPLFGCSICVLDASFHYITKADSRLEPEQIGAYLTEFDLRTERKGAFLLELKGGDYLCVNLFNANGAYIGCVYFSGKSNFAEADLTLAEFLARLIEKSIERDPSILISEQSVLKTAFANLVNGYPLTANQKWALNVMQEGQHFVFITQYCANRASRLPRNYICGAFEREFPESYAFPKKNTIVCFLNVVPLVDKRGDYYAALNSRMSKFLRETNGVAGVSNGFSDPYGACIAYMQAEAAVESGKITNPGTRLFYFRSYALINMVINSMGNLPAQAYFTERLQALIRHDKVGPISYLDTLRTFLRTSMSYSQTAEELFVHRSTVVDRINRIERELDISLKDPDTRLQLEIILKAMEIEDMVHASKETTAAE